jgi:hypothetical protein
LHTTVAPPVYRENRWDQQKVPMASAFELTVNEHTVLITMFAVKYPLFRDTLPAYAIARCRLAVCPHLVDHHH